MNRAEAAELLGHAAAFDNRTVGIVDATAWAAALPDVPLDADTLAAVARFYGTPPKDPNQRLWMQPHDVRTHRRAIRSERALGFVYQPPLDAESGRTFLARYRAQLEAVASGRAPAPAGTPVLEGGPHESVAKRLAGFGREVPSEPDGRRGALGVPCPRCDAPIGRSCRTSVRRRRMADPHPARIDAAKGAR